MFALDIAFYRTRIPSDIDNLLRARAEGKQISKEDCIVIDVVDSTRQHRLITLASIFGFDLYHDFRGQHVSRAHRAASTITSHAETALSAQPVIPSAASITTVTEEVNLFAPKWSDDRLNHSVLKWFRRGNVFICPLPQGSVLIGKGNGWTVHGEVNAHRFRRDGIQSLAQALAFAERNLKYFGADLLKKIDAEAQSESQEVTPIQAELLRSTGDGSYRPGLSKSDASALIEATYVAQLGAECLKREPAPQLAAAALPRETATGLDAFLYGKAVKASRLQWYQSENGGYFLDIRAGEHIEARRDSSGMWIVKGKVREQEFSQNGFANEIQAIQFADSMVRKLGSEFREILDRNSVKNREKASRIQLIFLKRFLSEDVLSKLRLTTLSRGDAQVLLRKAIHDRMCRRLESQSHNLKAVAKAASDSR